MIATTFRQLHKSRACRSGYRELARMYGGIDAYGPDTPIPMRDLFLRGYPLGDAVWVLLEACGPEGIEAVEAFVADTAGRARPLWERAYPAAKDAAEALEAAQADSWANPYDAKASAAMYAARAATWPLDKATEATADAAGAWGDSGGEDAARRERQMQMIRLAELLA